MANVPSLYFRPVNGGTAVLTNVPSSATTVNLVAANPRRSGMTIRNESTAILYLKYGSTASLTSYTDQVGPNTTWVMPAGAVYAGAIDGLWASANGNARITDISS